MKKSYRVAGFRLDIRGDESLFPEGLGNLSPFETEDTESPLFSLELVRELPDTQMEPLYTDVPEAGMPRISLYRTEEGLAMEMAPLANLPFSGRMLLYAGDGTQGAPYPESRLQLLEPRQGAFAVNNALMLLFAFNTALLGALEMHASVVRNGGRGYLFLGRSGTGKSTHSSLWLKHIPGTDLLNDDNPVLRLEADGTVRVYGTPWSGKTPCYKNESVPAGAIVRLRQAPENRIERLSPVQSYASLYASCSAFRPLKELADGWHRTLEGIVSVLPCYRLDCLPDEAAARLCHDTVTRHE
jgi:hypothetical protein